MDAGKKQLSNAGAGTLLAVVGASGVGKDSLIAHARRELSVDGSVLFVRRIVTRPALAAAEDHDHLTPSEFAAALAAGRFAVHWDAHGLRYGVPASVRDHLADGGTAVLNGSRAALPVIRSAFEKIVVIHITARPEIIAARLANRGRENEGDITLRMQRGAIALSDCGERIEIDNSGPFEAASVAFLNIIRSVACGMAATS
ncbi:MAG: phosphonate metabolism protein/1,5-bisphosphokinase (PRPP-forming) PhnN [Hyphomicrobiales bacterium]|nr:phosphonate metabolism protein/1,5-bisphosphokinase (PRPP-forming) PhnN [Hyphomicrobiales bacterium]